MKNNIKKSTKINFWKMHGLGNDFVVIDGINQNIKLEKKYIRELANRNTGVGFDQLLLILPSKIADVTCRIFNSDGSEAEQCGNGMRCVALFVVQNKLVINKKLTIETISGVVKAELKDDNLVEINLKSPASYSASLELSFQTLNKSLQIFSLSLGNPHAILLVESLENYSITEIGAAISQHPAFPKQTNVGFVEQIDQHTIRLKTFERGAGETLACGSNACAAVVAGILQHQLLSPVSVQLPLGELQISWAGDDIQQIGPAEKIFCGTIDV